MKKGEKKVNVATPQYMLHESPKPGTHLHRVLILAGEGVDGSLLDTLLALRQTLVPRIRG